jgi:hypothetical protein
MSDAYREDPQARAEIRAMRKELDLVTGLLCALLRTVHRDDLSPEAKAWFEAHLKHDREQGRP